MRSTQPLTPRRVRRASTIAIVLAGTLAIAGCTGAGAATTTPTQAAKDLASAAVATVAPAGAPADAAGTVVGAPAGVATSGGVSGGGTAASAIAYPYPIYGGSPGTAPDHSILVMGVGQAELKANGSNRSSAEHTALLAAVDDARTRADAVAAATGVSIHGVLSVSVAVGQSWVTPVAIDTPGGVIPQTPETAPGAAPGATPSQPTMPQLQVTVTIAYSIG